MLRIFKLFLIIASVLVHFNDGRVGIRIRVTDYSNYYNLIYNGDQCEAFYWLGDNCDPMFEICVTSGYHGCNIKWQFINVMYNTWHVSVVWEQTFTLDTFPKIVRVTVKVTDHDRHSAHDHIGNFKNDFYINQLGFNYWQKMEKTPWRLNVNMVSQVLVWCIRDYYGSTCENHCVSKPPLYYCNTDTGAKICTYDCGLHGKCVLISLHASEYAECRCLNGWEGVKCETKLRTSTTFLPSINTTFESSTTTEKHTSIVFSKLKGVTLASRYPPSIALEGTTYAKSDDQIIKTQIIPEYSETNPQLSTLSFDSENDNSNETLNATLKNSKFSIKDGLSNHFKINASQILIIIGSFIVTGLILLFVFRYLDLKYKLKFSNQSQVHRSLPPVIFKSNHNDQDCTLYTMADSEYDTCSIRTNSNDHPTDIKSQNNAIEEDYHLYEIPISKIIPI